MFIKLSKIIKTLFLPFLLILVISSNSNAYNLHNNILFEVQSDNQQKNFREKHKKFFELKNIIKKDLSINSTRDLNLLPDIEKLKKNCKSIALLDAITGDWNYKYGNYDVNTKYFVVTTSILNSSKEPRLEIFFNKFGAVIFGYHNKSDIDPYKLQKIKEIFEKNNYLKKDDKIENYFNYFNENQIKDLLKYFDEKRSWKGVLDDLPEEFSEYRERFFDVNEEIFGISFCVWRKYSDKKWNIGSVYFPESKNNTIKTQDNYPYIFDSLDGSAELLWDIIEQPERIMLKIIESRKLWDKFEEGKILDYDSVKKLFSNLDEEFINEKLARKINPDLNLNFVNYNISATGYYIIKE